MIGTEPHAWETGLMDSITYVGLDVHRARVCAALAESGPRRRGPPGLGFRQPFRASPEAGRPTEQRGSSADNGLAPMLRK
jgi:hypothetical protein